MMLGSRLIVSISLLLLLLLSSELVTANSGEVQMSGEQAPSSAEGENCRDFTMAEFMHLYNERRLSSPFIHIGVNLTIGEAAQSDRSRFRSLIRKARYGNFRQLSRGEVCNGVTARSRPNRFCCPWEYTCDYNPRRFPAYLFHAKCMENNWVGQGGSAKCREVYHPIPVLVTTGCNPITSRRDWVWRQEMVSVACSCVTK